MIIRRTLLFAMFAVFLAGMAGTQAQVTTAFTYQGRLQADGSPASGLYDLQFTLHDNQTNGGQIGAAFTTTALPVTNGFFVVTLDFGAGSFGSEERWLQIAVRSNGVPDAFTSLVPRQQITPVPHALFAETAGNVPAGSLTSTQLAAGAVTGPKIADGQIVRSINSLSDAVSIVPGEGLTLTTGSNTVQLAAAPPNCNTYSNCYWSLSGNGNITPGVNFFGTIAGELAPLEFRVNDTHAMRFEPGSATPNIIGGHGSNAVSAGAMGATIGGGGESARPNTIASEFATISGGRGNNILRLASNSTIGGGTNNTIGEPERPILNESCTVSGGSLNHTSGEYNTISGGQSNRTLVSFFGPAGYATIGGGSGNVMNGSYYSTIGGGRANSIGTFGSFATIGGGDGNQIMSEHGSGTIAGGSANSIGNTAYGSTISGGERNRIDSFASGSAIGGGRDNIIRSTGGQGNGTIPGGSQNEARGAAFAAGTGAKAIHTGAFVWGDSTGGDVASTNENSVTMRASGGYRLFTDSAATVGATLVSGSGSWTTMSDRNSKENFREVDPRDVLRKVAALPVQSWNYKSQGPAIRHIGPTAQDFKAAFDIGESDTGISAVDVDGIALAAIQGLNQKLEEQIKIQNAEIRALRSALETTLAQVKATQSELEKTSR